MAAMAEAESSQQQLDLTNAHLHSLAGVAISPTLTLVDLTANRLTTIEPAVLALTGLTSLSLRQNLLKDAAVADELASKPLLQQLELRDNLLQAVPRLSGFTQLTRLELSYNEIGSMAPLSSLGPIALQELYLACNKVRTVESLQQLTSLRVLELGSNRIPSLQGLESLVALEELWLGHNRVTKIDGLSGLSRLRKLSLQSNRLTSMQGVSKLALLEELYLSHNAIQHIAGLERLTRLQILDVSSNGLAQADGLHTLQGLQDLWLNHNQLASVEQLASDLATIKESITTIYLEGNKLAQHPEYKQQVLAMLPNLKQLDADDV